VLQCSGAVKAPRTSLSHLPAPEISAAAFAKQAMSAWKQWNGIYKVQSFGLYSGKFYWNPNEW